jgi:hypothetical protein
VVSDGGRRHRRAVRSPAVRTAEQGLGVEQQPISGVERAVFGAVGRQEVDEWLSLHLTERLHVGLSQVLFRSGRVAAVFGVSLVDGRRVTVKAHRSPADSVYLTVAADRQRHLFEAGYPCPEPLDGPSPTDGVAAVTEMLLVDGTAGDGHKPLIRRAMATSLFDQIQLLNGATRMDVVVAGAPAWSHYEAGPWPKPHDPIFDFTTTISGFEWLDDLARRAADVLREHEASSFVAHGDWNCGNVRFSDHRVSASYDWDSLAAAPEAVLVGLSAGSFTSGGVQGADAPTPEETSAFVCDYEDARRETFTPPARLAAAAAATWVLAYNARCELSFFGPAPRVGHALEALDNHRDTYLAMG